MEWKKIITHHKPKTNYTMTKDEAKIVCRWIKELRMPDGYSSNLARCDDIKKGSIHSVKSHDCHVFMETLLPIAFSSLPMHVLNPLIEISHFFKDLCSTTLKEDSYENRRKIFLSLFANWKEYFHQDSLLQWSISLFIFHMKHGLADQYNIGGCIHLKGDTIIKF